MSAAQESGQGPGSGSSTPTGTAASRGTKRKMVQEQQQQQLQQTKRQKGELTTPILAPNAFPKEYPFNKDSYRYVLAEADPHAPFRQVRHDRMNNFALHCQTLVSRSLTKPRTWQANPFQGFFVES